MIIPRPLLRQPVLRWSDSRRWSARPDGLDRADRVVVAGDHVIDLIGIAVGVHDGDDRDAQDAGFRHGDVLLARVDHEQRAGELLHLADAAQVRFELFALMLQADDFLLGQHIELALLLHAVDLVRKLVSMPPSQRLLT